MPVYRITAPDGKKYKITAPEGATKEQALAKFQESYQAEIDTTPSEPDFMKDRSGMENFFAGMGKSIYDTGRGIGNLVGLVSDEEIRRARELDKYLMNTGAGTAGNVVGHAAQLLAPAGALAKGGSGAAKISQMLANPQSYKAAAGVGAGYSALQPALSPQERAINAATGGLGGAAGLTAGRLLQGAVQGGKSLIEPLSKKGKERIVSRFLGDHIPDPKKVADSLGDIRTNVGGAPIKTSEAAQDAAVSQLERTARSQNPLFNARLSQIEDLQNKARMDQLNRLFVPTQTDAKKAMAKAVTKRFKDVPVNLTPLNRMVDGMKKQSALDDSVMKVLDHVKAKLGEVKDLRDLYELRKTLTSDKLPKMEGFDAATILNIRSAIDDAAAQQSPLYRDYLKKYAEMSIPENQNAVLKEITKRATAQIQNPAEKVMQGASEDVLSPAKMSGALRADEKLVKAATGFPKSKGIQQTLTPDQWQGVQGVHQDLIRSSKAASQGKAIGSNTAQNLAGTNIVNRSFGGILPDSLVDHVTTGLPARAANVIYGGSNEQMQELLSQALIDPALMKRLIELDANNLLGRELSNAIQLLGSTTGTGSGLGLLQQ